MYACTYGCGISLNMASSVTSPRNWQWPRNERHQQAAAPLDMGLAEPEQVLRVSSVRMPLPGGKQ